MRPGPLPHLGLETPFWQADLPHVAGLDEAGRGAWAGPVSAATVILPPESNISKQLQGVRDSKQMTARQREHWAEQIKSHAAAWAVGFASPQEIDAIGIVPSTRLAMARALAQLAQAPQHLLIDALLLPEIDISQTSIIRGDSASLSIAAASVLAKTARDALMVNMDEEYAGYSFARHKGYGTRQHQAALSKLGACEIHRKSFAPIRILLEGEVSTTPPTDTHTP
jgi:ribonuclease HII